MDGTKYSLANLETLNLSSDKWNQANKACNDYISERDQLDRQIDCLTECLTGGYIGYNEFCDRMKDIIKERDQITSIYHGLIDSIVGW